MPSLLALVAVSLLAADLHVAPDGADTNPGTAARPFATLTRARDEVRKLAAAGPVTVTVRGGTYRLTTGLQLAKADSGRPDARIVWQAAPGETVRLVGGPTLVGRDFQVVTDPARLARLEPAARGKVVVANVQGYPLGRYPDAFRGAPLVPEVFWNDQRLTPARWPNEGWATVAKIVDSGSIPRTGDNGTRGGSFTYSGDRPARWDVDAGVWLLGYWCFDWYEEAVRVKTIDRDQQRITLARPTLYGVKQGNPSPRRWRALNVFEELDQPGEYYLDAAAGQLYVWPPSDLRDARITLSTLNAPLIALVDVSHVTLRGFTLEAGLTCGVEVRGGEADVVERCELRNLRTVGVQVVGGHGHRVERCAVHDTGTGGIALDGGDRATLTPGGHEALNNHIWRFSQHQLTYASGLVLRGVGNRGAHNLLHDAPHMAVSLSGNDHVFEYNVVHDVCNASDDAGALYKGRNPSCRGNQIRYNYWYDIGAPMGHGTAAIYFDDGDGGDFVTGNVFVRCGYPGKGNFGTVFNHGGHGALADNNVFVDCLRPLGSSPWNDKRWREALAAGDWQNKLLKEVDITKPPFTTHYPALVGFMTPPAGAPRVNQATNNVLVRCKQVSSGNWQYAADGLWSTDVDPGFVDAAKGDYRLKADAEVFKRLPGFKAVPFERMGLEP